VIGDSVAIMTVINPVISGGGRREPMARNVEIKARLNQGAWEQVREQADRLSASPPEVINQKDTFFDVLHGRLKLREFVDGTGELIFYDRPDRPGPKTSTYTLFPTASPTALLEVLSQAIGVRGAVVKQRDLFLVGTTRVHLDRVQGLGLFVELEVALQGGETVDYGKDVAEQLMQQLGIEAGNLVSGAYIDMLEDSAT
jgi:adenylate cyclase class IV